MGSDIFSVLAKSRGRHGSMLDVDAPEAHFRTQSPLSPLAADRVTAGVALTRSDGPNGLRPRTGSRRHARSISLRFVTAAPPATARG